MYGITGVIADILREDGLVMNTWDEVAEEWMGPVETDMMHEMDIREDWYEVYVMANYGPSRLHYANAPKKYAY